MRGWHRHFLWALSLWGCLSMRPRAHGQDAELNKKIDAAIDKGVDYIKKFSDGNGRGLWSPSTCSLRGWTLLEMGVSAKDTTVRDLADYVRKEVAQPGNWAVYDLSLAIIFLDKLGDGGDEPLLESLAVRLMASQIGHGGWTYQCPQVNAAERARLAKVIEDADKLRKLGLVLKAKPRTPAEVRQSVERQMKTLEGGPAPGQEGADNSNTQFAMMALWVARRHNLPVDKHLEKVGERFRTTQVKSGHWGYEPHREGLEYNPRDYPSMTCAGLLGLALAEGIKPDPKDLTQDAQVKRGLEVLTGAMEPDFTGRHYYYFLFSLERMAVIYKIKKIGERDWYLWGARKLVDGQSPHGHWALDYGGDAETCLALLFLKRANVAKDLAEILEAPIRKGPGNKTPATKKIPDNLFDTPELSPKKDPAKRSSWLQPHPRRLTLAPREGEWAARGAIRMIGAPFQAPTRPVAPPRQKIESHLA